MKHFLLLSLLLIVCTIARAEETIAYTTDGRLVILYEDGTWTFFKHNDNYDPLLFGHWKYWEPEKTARFFFASDGTGYKQYWNYSERKDFTWHTEDDRIHLLLSDGTKESHPYKVTVVKGILYLTMDLGVAVPREYVFAPSTGD